MSDVTVKESRAYDSQDVNTVILKILRLMITLVSQEKWQLHKERDHSIPATKGWRI